MTTTTVSISNTRASLRKLAAVNGWAFGIADDSSNSDVFLRGDRKVHVGFRSPGYGTEGRFLAAFLIDLTDPFAGNGGDGIVDEGGVAKVRGWLKTAV